MVRRGQKIVSRSRRVIDTRPAAEEGTRSYIEARWRIVVSREGKAGRATQPPKPLLLDGGNGHRPNLQVAKSSTKLAIVDVAFEACVTRGQHTESDAAPA
jgi:hypothetical protein